MYEAYLSLVDSIRDDTQLLLDSPLPNNYYRRDLATILESANHLKSKLSQLQNYSKEQIAHMSFELRTPLTSLSGYSQMIAEHPIVYQGQSLDEAGIVCAKQIHKAGQLLQFKINNLLDFCRVATNQSYLDFYECELGKSITSFVSPLITSRIENQISKPLYCYGDEYHLIWTIHRLVLAVTPTFSSVDMIFSEGSQNADSVEFVFEVISQAIQLTDDEAKRLIERDYAEARSEFCLYLANAIIRLHDGTLRFAITPNQNAKFWLVLPTIDSIKRKSG
jgi:signal transduction histidine kinase